MIPFQHLKRFRYLGTYLRSLSRYQPRLPPPSTLVPSLSPTTERRNGPPRSAHSLDYLHRRHQEHVNIARLFPVPLRMTRCVSLSLILSGRWVLLPPQPASSWISLSLSLPSPLFLLQHISFEFLCPRVATE